MKRANTMSTITVELIIKMKTKFTSSNAENTNGFISPQMSNFQKKGTWEWASVPTQPAIAPSIMPIPLHLALSSR